MRRRNEEKHRFKQLFLKEIEKVPRGATMSDEQIKDFVIRNDLSLNKADTMQCIVKMEDAIGLLLKKRLKRIRCEGYLILQPEVQATDAIYDGKRKVESVLKKTGKRLVAVDTAEFSEAQKRELLHRTSAVDSFLQIIQNSSVNRKIVNRREVGLLGETASAARSINQIEGGSND